MTGCSEINPFTLFSAVVGEKISSFCFICPHTVVTLWSLLYIYFWLLQCPGSPSGINKILLKPFYPFSLG